MPNALLGWNILIPRGGEWGNSVAELVRANGATPVIAPLIEFVPPEDDQPLNAGLRELAAGGFDWLVVTSATTVSTLAGATIPSSTRVAAVGPATAAALAEAGMPVDLVPETDFSAASLADALAAQRGDRDQSQDLARPSDLGLRIFLPQSASADSALAHGLSAAGYEVRAVPAYRTVSVPAPGELDARLRSGDAWAILLTSGSVAREVAGQFSPFPVAPTARVALVAIGTRTAALAVALGLPVAAVAAQQSIASMLDALLPLAKEQP